MTTPDQLRAARAILGLSQAEVAEMSGKTTKTIRRAENGEAVVAGETIATIRAALEARGVEFLPENGGGAGVRLKEKRE
nr:helix-turn-helix transcriptional regulator [Oceanicola sp. S124]